MTLRGKIYSKILQRIVSGEYPPGKKLPTERDFAVEFKTTVWTIHTVMNELEENAFIERHRSLGTFVCDNIAMQKVLREKNRNSKNVLTIAARDFFYTKYGFEDIIGHLEHRLAETGYNVLYEDMPENSEALERFLNNCSSSGINAIVIFPERKEMTFMYHNTELFLRFPGDVFYFNRGIESIDYLPLNSVCLDMLQSGKTAAAWILGKGFNDIAFTCGSETLSTYWLSSRYNGFKFQLKQCEKRHKLVTGKSNEIVFKPIADFIRSSKTLPVIVSCNDVWAAGIYDYLEALKIKACEDYYMLSFDNHPHYKNYKLINIAWPLNKVSEIIADTIGKNLSEDFHNICSLKYQLRPLVNERGIKIKL